MRLSGEVFAFSVLTFMSTIGVQAATAQTQSAAQTNAGTGARAGNNIGTRESYPLSPYASNISAADTKSTIAPTAPEPDVGANATVQQLLVAGKQALAAGKTGTTDEALEQAETQLLSRSVAQTQTDVTSQDPMVAQITQARTSLGSGDKAGTLHIINQILASNSPELAD